MTEAVDLTLTGIAAAALYYAAAYTYRALTIRPHRGTHRKPRRPHR
jgi:hypothetical protein